MLPCLNKKFFGFECPGCGGQRAFIFLIKGEFSQAFILYPAIYPLVILASVVLLNMISPSKIYEKLTTFFAVISVATILISYILKFL